MLAPFCGAAWQSKLDADAAPGRSFAGVLAARAGRAYPRRPMVDPKEPAENGEKTSPTFAEVLAGAPFASECIVASGIYGHPTLPVISLYCAMKQCERMMSHDGEWAHRPPDPQAKSNGQREYARSIENQVALYTCRHCKISVVSIPLKLKRVREDSKTVRYAVTKIGQCPKHAPRILARVERFIQAVSPADLALYRKGWGDEHVGNGIGAYAYYRRVVEDIWNKLLDRLIEVATRASDAESEKQLTAAKGQWKFLQAVDDILPAVPPSLLIDTHNPLKLLHQAFSDGVHNLDDAECLRRAEDGRRVLHELLARMDEVLKNNKELTASIARLQAANAKKTKKAGSE
jgi:hypothetical protein